LKPFIVYQVSYKSQKIILKAAMDLVDLTRNELITLRSDVSYSLLYNNAKIHALSLGITGEEEEERNTRLSRKLKSSKKLLLEKVIQ